MSDLSNVGSKGGIPEFQKISNVFCRTVITSSLSDMTDIQMENSSPEMPEGAGPVLDADSARNVAGKSRSCGIDCVIQEERRLLLQQRAEPDAQSQQHATFVGVSLSGGGVRAGASSLGFLMGLQQSGLLQHVDYLSTVSGGGYAGALLTAEKAVIRESGNGVSAATAESPHLFFGDPSKDGADTASTSDYAGLKQLRRMVVQCNYLIRQQGWLSRALLGVVAMGTVSAATLVFLTSLLSYVFRALYYPAVLEFLKVLGFEGDLIIPMTPAVAMFLLWLLCWLLSFFRHYRKASGRSASYVFRAFVFCLVLGITMIAVTGDIDAEKLLQWTGVSQDLWKNVEGMGGWIKSGFLALIGASLIPYFRPSALLRSGKEREAGPQKLLFVLARNGLLLGVPLVLFGIFARENISAWNRDRDYRFEFKDLLSVPSELALDLGPELYLLQQCQQVLQGHGKNEDAVAQLRHSVASHLYTPDVKKEYLRYQFCQRKFEVLNAGGASAGEAEQLARLNPSNELSRTRRFALMFSFLLDWRQPDAESEGFAGMLYWLRESRHSQRRLMFLLNSRLMSASLPKAAACPLAAISGGATEALRKDVSKSSAPKNESAKTDAVRGAEPVVDLAAVRRAVQMSDRLWAMEVLSTTGVGEESAASLSKLRPSPAEWLETRGEKNHQLLAEEGGDVNPAQRQKDRQSVLESPPSMQPLFGLSGSERPRLEIDGEMLSDDDLERLLSSLLKSHQAIVAAVFPGTIRPRDAQAEIFSSVVHTRDQQIRWGIVVWSFWVALLLSAIWDLNSLSWHGFYARQLGMFWIRAASGEDRVLTLKELARPPAMRPLHLINAAVCLTGRSRAEDNGQGENPDHFLLSSLYCGSEHPGIGFARTLNSSYGDLQLADAIALSGAALSPWATTNPLVRVLLLVMNLRTGLWLPNPGLAAERGTSRRSWDTIIDRHLFSPLRWLWLRFVPAGAWTLRPRDPEKWSHLLVTDGGHYENLGIESLLKRRCRLILCVDASEDGKYEFQGLAIAMNRARARDGIQFLDASSDRPCGFPEKLLPDEKTRLSGERFFAIRIRYPEAGNTGEPEDGVLLLVKSVLLSKDPFELQQHRREFAAFPNDPTSDQFFSPDKFEAYRFLGYTAASQLADRLQAEGNLETAELLRRLKREFCSATDAAAILGELATELKQLDEPDALDRLSNADQFSISSLLRRWNRLNESDSISIQNALFDLTDFRSRLRKLHQSVKFRHHRTVLEKLDWKLALAAKEIAAVPQKIRAPRTQKKG